MANFQTQQIIFVLRSIGIGKGEIVKSRQKLTPALIPTPNTIQWNNKAWRYA